MKIKRPSVKNSRLKLLFVSIAAALLVATGTYWYILTNSQKVGEDGINYSPPTKVDEQLNDKIKQELGDNSNDDSAVASPEQPSAPADDSRKMSVTPVISAWGQPEGPGKELHLNGYVPEVIETNGTCTLTLRRDGKTVSAQKTALRNAQNTSCGQISIPYEQLAPGEWMAVLSYSSPSSTGSSTVTTIEVK